MFRRIAKVFSRVAKDEKGSTAMEYGLLAAIIAVAIIVGATSAGNALDTLFTSVGTKLSTQAASIQ